MSEPPVTEQELVVHLYAPLVGRNAEPAYELVRGIWAGCRDELRMTEPITGAGVGSALPRALAGLPGADGPVAARQDRPGDRQALVRREHDVLNLSIAFAQPRDPRTGGRTLGWVEFAGLWRRVGPDRAGPLLGEAWLYVAKAALPADADAVAALGAVVERALPYRDDRPAGLWLGGAMVGRFLVWDLRPDTDREKVRELVVLARPDDDPALGAWVWTDGRPGLPPLARYLMHAAKLRHHARLLDAWHDRPDRESAILVELRETLGAGEVAGSRDVLGERLDRVREAEAKLIVLRGELERLQLSGEQARANLRDAAPGGAPFPLDDRLAQWLGDQTADDLRYLESDRAQLAQWQRLIESALPPAEEPPSSPAHRARVLPDTARPEVDVARQVFVVHGRDERLRRSIFDLLRSVGLWPLEWEHLVAATEKAAPSRIGAIMSAPGRARAAVVLLAPEDLVAAHPDVPTDPETSAQTRLSASADVQFQAGLAWVAYADRTVVVTVGQAQPSGLLSGVVPVRFDGGAASINALVTRLASAGCTVDTTGTDWLDTSPFAGLGVFTRGVPDRSRRRDPGD